MVSLGRVLVSDSEAGFVEVWAFVGMPNSCYIIYCILDVLRNSSVFRLAFEFFCKENLNFVLSGGCLWAGLRELAFLIALAPEDFFKSSFHIHRRKLAKGNRLAICFLEAQISDVFFKRDV